MAFGLFVSDNLDQALANMPGQMDTINAIGSRPEAHRELSGCLRQLERLQLVFTRLGNPSTDANVTITTAGMELLLTT